MPEEFPTRSAHFEQLAPSTRPRHRHRRARTFQGPPGAPEGRPGRPGILGDTTRRRPNPPSRR